jgi:lipid A oxidase
VFANAMYRFNPLMERRLTPYVGVGAGIAIPHVEVILKGVPAPQNRTWEYQVAGGAAQAFAGLEWSFDKNWSAFAEAKISYSHLATELADGGALKTYLWQPHLAIGLTYRFGGR